MTDDRRLTSFATLPVLVAFSCLAFAQSKTDLRYNIAPGATVSITNDFGPVTVRAATGSQLIVSATPHSEKVKVETSGSQSGRRFDFVSHLEQKGSAEESRVDYDVQLPPVASLVIHAGNGPVKIQGGSSDMTIEAGTGAVEVRDASNGHVHVRTMSGPVTLSNIVNGHVEISSISGEVTLTNVSGTQVTANTTSSPIHFSGDAAGNGDYSLSSHSGNIDVLLLASASVDVIARSVTGAVEDSFQLQPASHPTITIVPGKSFAGRANAGASSLHLRTFSGKISVKKQ